jgi:hypothetical protein
MCRRVTKEESDIRTATIATAILLAGTAMSGRAGDRKPESQALAALKPFQPEVAADQSKPGKPVIRIYFPGNISKKLTDDDLIQLQSFPHRLPPLDAHVDDTRRPRLAPAADPGAGRKAGQSVEENGRLFSHQCPGKRT